MDPKTHRKIPPKFPNVIIFLIDLGWEQQNNRTTVKKNLQSHGLNSSDRGRHVSSSCGSIRWTWYHDDVLIPFYLLHQTLHQSFCRHVIPIKTGLHKAQSENDPQRRGRLPLRLEIDIAAFYDIQIFSTTVGAFATSPDNCVFAQLGGTNMVVTPLLDTGRRITRSPVARGLESRHWYVYHILTHPSLCPISYILYPVPYTTLSIGALHTHT